MNIYHLITRNEEHFFVRATSFEVALAKVSKLSGSFVSCWFIATSLSQGATIL
jgi:hypothetical protein